MLNIKWDVQIQLYKSHIIWMGGNFYPESTSAQCSTLESLKTTELIAFLIYFIHLSTYTLFYTESLLTEHVNH